MDALISFLNDPIFYSLSITLLHFLWQGFIVAFGLHLILKAVSNKHSHSRYLATLCAMALNVILPVITFFIVYEPEVPVAAVAGAVTSFSETSYLITQQFSVWQFEWREFVPFLSLGWMIGVTYLSAHLLYEMFRVYQLPRNGVVQPSDQLQAMFDHLSQQLEVNKVTKLLISMKAEVPMVVGWIRPVVLLPVSMSCGLTTAQLEMLLAHELAHVKRYDYLVNFVQTLVEVILFFHPCVKWVSKQVRAEREYCCDDVAVKHCGNAIAYATALTDAEMLRPHNIPQLAMAASGGNLKKRIFRVVGQHSCSPRYAGQWLVGVFSFALVGSVFTASHVVGMTQTYDTAAASGKLEDSFVVMVEPKPTIEEQAVIEPVELKPEMATPVAKEAESKVAIETTKIAPAQEISEEEVAEKQQPIAELVAEKQPEPKAELVAKKQPVTTLPTKAPATEDQKQSQKQPEPEAKAVVEELVAAKEVEVEKQDIAEKAQPAKEITKIETVETQEAETVKVEEEPKPVRVSPQLVRNVLPNYPSKAINKALESDIYVSFVVNKKGRVRDVSFENVVHPSFKRSIKSALKQWRFEAGTLDGKAVDMRMNKIFSFTEPPERSRATTGSRIVKS